MEYTFERKQVGRRNMWVREWSCGNYADVVRYDFVSYDTCIGMYFPSDGILYIGDYACYSPTTRKHASVMINMVNDMAGSFFNYYDVKAVVRENDEILSTRSGLQLLPGKQLESRLQCNFRLDKDYCNEMWGCALCPM